MVWGGDRAGLGRKRRDVSWHLAAALKGSAKAQVRRDALWRCNTLHALQYAVVR
jgi:hypothetical protein